jgi:competence protein ComEA
MSRTDELRALGGRRAPSRSARSRMRPLPLPALVVAALLCALVAAIALFGADRGRGESIVLSTVPPATAAPVVGLPADVPTGGTAPPDAPAPAPAGPTAAPLLQIHVAGAVREPGVVPLPDGARVVDAIGAAGGQTEDADLARLNLAAPVVDGTRVYVPAAGEEVPVVLGDPVPPAGSPAGSAVGDQQGAGSGGGDGADGAVIDLNTATAAELESLPGIGPKTAADIIAHRTDSGPFSSPDDLLEVSGIGPKKLAGLLDRVTV